MKLLTICSKDIGIDLGTSNILITIKGKGIVLREPAVVAIDDKTGDILATGYEAKEMLGKTPENIRAIKPMKDGVIADFTATQLMLKKMIKKVCQRYNARRPRVVVGVPSGITEVEERAVEESIIQAGAREVFLIEEPMAAAIGAGLPVGEPTGSMVLDIGGGTSEVAVISLGDIVAHNSVRVAGDKFDDAIMIYVKKKYGLTIGERTAEEVKINIGSAYPHENEKTMTIKGRNTVDGLPKDVTISAEEVRNALASPLATIIDGVIDTLEKTPPELSADIIDRGITLTGGGALLKGLDLLISRQTGMPVHIADRPLDCVADGAGKRLETVMPKDFYRDRRR